ncbi:hypothetical protein [Spiroplasma chrysopicola]|uniref:Putative sugar-phospahte nucleotidyltransferase n=1 Tax=Spiroplasma chrysopicola DF-1 TaxID=1276227 RepID=R4U4L3_9MOLU|nr:hypothetical protein [Spiroplasma chrysopicola]AGM25508.1 putative sugar-phospahte nucleotidyltransferase [Spiroplasma chrysopicola DF-1]
MKQLRLFEELYDVKTTDEWYTFPKTIEALNIYLPQNSNILCPFSWKESNFVKVLSKYHNVVYSHLSKGTILKNFYSYTKNDLKNIDFIIDNPPFSTRNEVFMKLYELNIPFAMLVPLVTITKKCVRDRIEDLSILFFKKRQIFFNQDGKVQGSPYDTVFICYGNVLPKQITMSEYQGTGEN